jgi:hypothetical protein
MLRLGDNPRAVEQHRLASDANHQIAQETDAQRHDGGGMCKRLLESSTRKASRITEHRMVVGQFEVCCARNIPVADKRHCTGPCYKQRSLELVS